MPILYTVISRGTTILAKHASCTGNFSQVTEQILSKISPNDPPKLTYSHGTFLFHYIKESGILYLCITDDDFERSRAFLYLEEIRGRFENTYGNGIQEALPYAMNSDFSLLLESEMKRYSESRENHDGISRVQGQLDEIKDIMVRNIDNITSRGERLELLVNKAENLNASSVSFRKTSRNVARTMYWKNIKFSVIVGFVILLIIYLIVSFACGGLGWGNCVGSSTNSTPPAP